MQRNKALPKLVESIPRLKDFYNSFDDLQVSEDDKKNFEKLLSELSATERELLGVKSHFYLIDLKNVGGLVMPVILKLTHADGTTAELRLPAELWVRDSLAVTKLVISSQPIVSVELDPHLETADADRSNNYFPPQIQKSRFRVFRDQKEQNAMQKAGLGRKPESSPPAGTPQP